MPCQTDRQQLANDLIGNYIAHVAAEELMFPDLDSGSESDSDSSSSVPSPDNSKYGSEALALMLLGCFRITRPLQWFFRSDAALPSCNVGKYKFNAQIVLNLSLRQLWIPLVEVKVTPDLTAGKGMSTLLDETSFHLCFTGNHFCSILTLLHFAKSACGVWPLSSCSLCSS